MLFLKCSGLLLFGLSFCMFTSLLISINCGALARMLAVRRAILPLESFSALRAICLSPASSNSLYSSYRLFVNFSNDPQREIALIYCILLKFGASKYLIKSRSLRHSKTKINNSLGAAHHFKAELI